MIFQATHEFLCFLRDPDFPPQLSFSCGGVPPLGALNQIQLSVISQGGGGWLVQNLLGNLGIFLFSLWGVGEIHLIWLVGNGWGCAL